MLPGRLGTSDFWLAWMVVVSIMSKPASDPLMLVALVMLVPKVISAAVPELNVSKPEVSTPSSSNVSAATLATRTTRSCSWCMPCTWRNT